MKVSGFDELERDLKRMQKAASELDGTHQIPFEKLFDRSFMRSHTSHSSIDSFLKAGGFDAKTNKEFEAIPDKELDAYVRKATRFKSWEDMMETAVEEYIQDQLGF